jgi:hypothetical protein
MLKKIIKFPILFSFIVSIIMSAIIYASFFDIYQKRFKLSRYSEVKYVGEFSNQDTLDYLGIIDVYKIFPISMVKFQKIYKQKDCFIRFDGYTHREILFVTQHWYDEKFDHDLSKECLQVFNKFFIDDTQGFVELKFKKKIKFEIKYDQVDIYTAPNRLVFIAQPLNFFLLIFFNIFIIIFSFIQFKKKNNIL